MFILCILYRGISRVKYYKRYHILYTMSCNFISCMVCLFQLGMSPLRPLMVLYCYPGAPSFSQVIVNHLGTCKWNLRVPNLQMNCSNLTRMRGYQDSIPAICLPGEIHYLHIQWINNYRGMYFIFVYDVICKYRYNLCIPCNWALCVSPTCPHGLLLLVILTLYMINSF